MPNPIETSKYEQIKAFFDEGTMSLSQTAKKFGVDRGSLSQRMRMEDGYVFKQNNQKYTYNEDFFDKIDNEASAYFLGLLYADGYVAKNTTKLEITLKDRDILETFCNHICPGLRIAEKKVKLKDFCGTYYRININNRKIHDDLIKLGCFNKKSLTLKFPSEDQVPSKFLRHFIRGYLDGDGCLTKNRSCSYGCQLSFMGTKEFLYGLQSFLRRLNLIRRNYKMYQRAPEKNTYTFRVGGSEVTHIILLYLFSNCEIYLPRKYNIVKKYLPFIEEIQ